MTFEAKFALVIGLGLVASALGWYWKAKTGRAKLIHRGELVDLSRLEAVKHGKPVTRFGKKATLLQFSTEVCSQCKQTAKVFGELESNHKDLLHLEVDLTNRLDLAAHFGVLQTPTTLVLNSSGRVLARVGGAPKPNVIQSELEKLDIK
jgi:thiol-disulfide isomerase/thioredoxin